MKNLKVKSILFSLLAIMAVAVLMISCEQESVLKDAIESTPDSDFETLIINNASTNEDGAVILDLSTEDFKYALQLIIGISNTDVFFEDEENRKVFRQNIIKVLVDNGIQSRNCDKRYFAEAYSHQQGYTSRSSNSFAKAIRFGKTGLWASAFDCIAFDEEYTGYYSNCPYAPCLCRVSASYGTNSSGSNISKICIIQQEEPDGPILVEE